MEQLAVIGAKWKSVEFLENKHEKLDELIKKRLFWEKKLNELELIIIEEGDKENEINNKKLEKQYQKEIKNIFSCNELDNF